MSASSDSSKSLNDTMEKLSYIEEYSMLDNLTKRFVSAQDISNIHIKLHKLKNRLKIKNDHSKPSSNIEYDIEEADNYIIEFKKGLNIGDIVLLNNNGAAFSRSIFPHQMWKSFVRVTLFTLEKSNESLHDGYIFDTMTKQGYINDARFNIVVYPTEIIGVVYANDPNTRALYEYWYNFIIEQQNHLQTNNNFRRINTLMYMPDDTVARDSLYTLPFEGGRNVEYITFKDRNGKLKKKKVYKIRKSSIVADVKGVYLSVNVYAKKYNLQIKK
jgi:hypothetical protein